MKPQTESSDPGSSECAAELAEEAVRQSEERFRWMVDNVADCAIIMLDTTGHVVSWNRGAERIKGYTADEIIGQHFSRFYRKEDIKSGKPEQELLIATTDGRFEEEAWRVRKDGSQFWANVVIETMRDRAGVQIGFSKITRDRTERRLADAELTAAREAADAANQAKSDFLANMSHEIRTPMAAILGYADLMLDPIQSQSWHQNGLLAIRRNGQHLLEVINDVLDLSKIEAGGATVERVSCELPPVAAEAISITEPKAIEKGLTLSLEFSTPVPRTGLTDPLRLRQTLVNLIGNAIKFTEKGGVVVRVSCDGPSATNARMKFEVIDTGVGMTEQELPRLFKVFSQADASTTRRFGGTGLGLAISRRFARLLGGDITVSSQAGNGSAFTLDVRVGPVAAGDLVNGIIERRKAKRSTEESIISSESLRGIEILLAEDGLDNRIILSAYLRSAGATVEMVEDGGAAVDAVTRSLNEAHPYSIVLMDMQMPVLDGYRASSELRRKGYNGPIIALTAHAMLEDRVKCIKSGCSDYMSKPVDRVALLWIVARQTNRRLNEAAPALPPAVTAPIVVSTDAGPLLPRRSIRSQLADDPQFAEILAGFVSRLPGRTVELCRLKQARDSKDLAQAAHKLRGAAGTYGLAAISTAAALVEDQLLAGDAVADVVAGVESLIAMIRDVEGYDPKLEIGSPAIPSTISRRIPTGEEMDRPAQPVSRGAA